MHRDKETLRETTKMVKDFACSTLYKLPSSSFQKIAQDMINNRKAGDGSWIAKALLKEKNRIDYSRQQSRKFGFAPFTNLGFYTFRWIKEEYAGWVLPLMAEKLDKPEDIYAVWGVQFADAMDALGSKACEECEHLYQFVTSSKAWEEAEEARKDYLNDFKLHKKRHKAKKAMEQKFKSRNKNSFIKHPKMLHRIGVHRSQAAHS